MSHAVPSQHGVTPPSDAPASMVPSAQPAFANTIVNVTGEQEAATFSSIAMPVDLHIDSKLRIKMQGKSYVDLKKKKLRGVIVPQGSDN